MCATQFFFLASITLHKFISVSTLTVFSQAGVWVCCCIITTLVDTLLLHRKARRNLYSLFGHLYWSQMFCRYQDYQNLVELYERVVSGCLRTKRYMIRGQIKRDLFILSKLLQVLYSNMRSTCHCGLLLIMFLFLSELLHTIALMSVTLNFAAS